MQKSDAIRGNLAELSELLCPPRRAELFKLPTQLSETSMFLSVSPIAPSPQVWDDFPRHFNYNAMVLPQGKPLRTWWQRQTMAKTSTQKQFDTVLSGAFVSSNAQGSLKEHKDRVRRVFLGRLPKGGTAVEIGVWRGEFSKTILEIIGPQKLYLIDPWASAETGGNDQTFSEGPDDTKLERIFRRVKKKFRQEIKSGRIEIVRDQSVPALAGFDDEYISFAYINGDHSFEGVKKDLEAIIPKIKPGGIVAFNNYHRRGWWGDGVIRAINEFLGQRPGDFRIRTVAGAQIAIEKLARL
jgi:hypothetical protein